MRLDTFSLKIPRDLIDVIEEKAREKGRSFAEEARLALREYYKLPKNSFRICILWVSSIIFYLAENGLLDCD